MRKDIPQLPRWLEERNLVCVKLYYDNDNNNNNIIIIIIIDNQGNNKP